jgi:8-oxo-dGTP pyrophosphatase MutT (NUDIX family)
MSSLEPFPMGGMVENDSANRGLSHQLLERISSLVTEAHETKEYRPVGVAVIEDTAGNFLFVQSAKNPDDWWFPQGGVEPGEDATQAILRESQEELGVSPDQLALKDFFGSADLDAETVRADKRGFTRGKRYLFSISYIAAQLNSHSRNPSWQTIVGYRTTR